MERRKTVCLSFFTHKINKETTCKHVNSLFKFKLRFYFLKVRAICLGFLDF